MVCATITKANWLMLFREIHAVYSENRRKHIRSEGKLQNCRFAYIMHHFSGLTSATEQVSSRTADCRSAGQEIPTCYGTLKVQLL
jgi:hypothetical protein